MAYFADPKAALTGTDAATRQSIAKGVVSPTFTSLSGKQIPRGVVQLDIISGRNIDYVTSANTAARLRSALSATKHGQSPTTQRTYTAQLHESKADVIKTSTTLKANNKFILIGGVIFAIIAYFVVKGK